MGMPQIPSAELHLWASLCFQYGLGLAPCRPDFAAYYFELALAKKHPLALRLEAFWLQARAIAAPAAPAGVAIATPTTPTAEPAVAATATTTTASTAAAAIAGGSGTAAAMGALSSQLTHHRTASVRRLLELAADNGDPDAYHQLALCYALGVGVERSQRTYEQLLQYGASLGSSACALELAAIHNHGSIDRRTQSYLPLAPRYMAVAADVGLFAMFFGNEDDANGILRAAANRDNVQAMYALRDFHMNAARRTADASVAKRITERLAEHRQRFAPATAATPTSGGGGGGDGVTERHTVGHKDTPESTPEDVYYEWLVGDKVWH